MTRTLKATAAVLALAVALPVMASAEPKAVATVGMLADVAANVAGDCVAVETMMGPGTDPHLYKASAGDVRLLFSADAILYAGNNLEGQLGEASDADGADEQEADADGEMMPGSGDDEPGRPGQPPNFDPRQGARNAAAYRAFSLEFDEAVEAGNRAIALAHETRGPRHFEMSYPLLSLGLVHQAAGNPAAAEAAMLEAWDIRTEHLGAGNTRTLSVLLHLCKVVEDDGRLGEARRLRDQAVDDARAAVRECLWVDERTRAVVVLGDRGRTHFFNPEGQLVSSVRYSREAIERKRGAGLWRRASDDEARAFRKRLLPAD